MREGFEILFDGSMARRGERMLKALADAAPVGTAISTSYTATRKTIMMYGAGLPVRVETIKRHKAAGGKAVVWDLGYWDRDEAMRLSIGALHPSREQLAAAPDTGCRREHELREDADPDGPVLLVGLGTKSCALYGLAPMQWERGALLRLKERFPGRRILWRPKGRHIAALSGTVMCHGMPIEEALKGCSLVVCRHSNVGIDACIAGVPVETEDGAALALYWGNPNPSREQRTEFLRRLGYWNWKPSEAPLAWEWIRKLCA